MKVRKAFKRMMSMLLCVAMVMTTLDLSSITVRAEGSNVTTAGGDGITISGDSVNDANDVITGGEESGSNDEDEIIGGEESGSDDENEIIGGEESDSDDEDEIAGGEESDSDNEDENIGDEDDTVSGDEIPEDIIDESVSENALFDEIEILDPDTINIGNYDFDVVFEQTVSNNIILYLPYDGSATVDWNDANGGKSSADHLVITANDEEGNPINPDVLTVESESTGVVKIYDYKVNNKTEYYVHAVSAGTATITVHAEFGEEQSDIPLTVTVKQGKIDVIDKSTEDSIIVNSFGDIAETNAWIISEWGRQYDSWDQEFIQYYEPKKYTVKVYDALTINDSNAEYLNYILDRDIVVVEPNDYVVFDLNNQTWTFKTTNAYTFENGQTFINGKITATGAGLAVADCRIVSTIVNNEEVDRIIHPKVTLGVDVTTTNFTLGQHSAVVMDGTLKVTGTTYFSAESSLIDNNSVTLNNVYLHFDQIYYWMDGDELCSTENDVYPYNNGVMDAYISRYEDGTDASNSAILAINGNISGDGTLILNAGRASKKISKEIIPSLIRPYSDLNITVAYELMVSEEGAMLFTTSNSNYAKQYVRVWQEATYSGTYFLTYYNSIDKCVYPGWPEYCIKNVTLNTIEEYSTWTDLSNAVAAINDNYDYEVIINRETVDALGNFKFPKAASSITYRTGFLEINSQVAAKNITVYYTGDLTLTCDTVFNGIDFKRVSSGRDEAAPYTLTKVELAGYELAINNTVTFNTPVNFTDNKKAGTLRVQDGGQFFTYYANDEVDDDINKYPHNNGLMVISGSVTNVGNVIVEDNQLLVMTDYQTVSGTTVKNNSPGFTPVSFTVNGGAAVIAKGTITNLNIYGILYADELQLTNVVLGGAATRDYENNIIPGEPAYVESEGLFNITGVLISRTEGNCLATANSLDKNGALAAPYLNVSGSVVTYDDTEIMVYNTSIGKFDATDDTESVGSMLLTTKTGTVDQFVPYFNGTETNIPDECYDQSAESYKDCMFTSNNLSGYYLKKSGEKIYLRRGSDVNVVLAKGYGNAFFGDLDSEDIVGYYASWSDAVVAINNLKAPDAYELIALHNIGDEYKPVSLSFPSASCITDLTIACDNGACIFYTNGLTLTSNTLFAYVNLAPVKKEGQGYVGTNLAINAGAYTLEFNYINMPSVGGKPCGISSISGNGRNTVSFYSSYSDYTISSGFSNIGVLEIYQATVNVEKGNVNATLIDLEENGKLNIQKGNITATELDESGNGTTLHLVEGNINVTDASVGNVIIDAGDFTAKETAACNGQLSVGGKFTAKNAVLCLKSHGGRNIISAKGNVSITGMLTMQGNTIIRSESGTFTIKDISTEYNGGYTPNNSIVYSRTASGASPVKITGVVYADSTTRIQLVEENGEGIAGVAALASDAGNPAKVSPKATNMIAEIGTNASSLFIFGTLDNNYDFTYFGNVTEAQRYYYEIVKYNKGLYCWNVNSGFTLNRVVLTVGNEESVFLDWSEAVKEIGAIGDKTAEYTIHIGMVTDTVLTDTAANSSLSLPAANKCAGLTVAGNAGSVLEFTNTSLALTCNLTFDTVILHPTTKKISFSLGAYTLWFNDSNIDTAEDCVITGITGNSLTGTSGLMISTDQDDYSLYVNGNINNVGTVQFTGDKDAELKASGNINVGNVYVDRGVTATLCGSAKITTKTVKEETEITGITSNITIAKDITIVDPDNDTLVVRLFEKENELTPAYIKSKFTNANKADEYLKYTGIPFVKAVKAGIKAVKYGDCNSGIIIKKNGNILYVDADFVPYHLGWISEKKDDNGDYNSVEELDMIPCLTFADVVTEINNINDGRRKYIVELAADENGDVNKDKPESFVMPSSSKMDSLTIKSMSGQNVNLYYGNKNASTGKITAVSKLGFTTNTELENITFKDAELVKASEGKANYENRAPLNISLGGWDVYVNNVVFEGRAVIIDGGRTGSLVIYGGGFAAAKEPGDIEEFRSCYRTDVLIEGEIKNIYSIEMESNQTMIMRKYIPSAVDKVAKKDASLNVTYFPLGENIVQVDGSLSASYLYTTSRNMNDSDDSIVVVEKAFTISGLVSSEYGDLVLLGRQKADAAKTPYLNITGAVDQESKTIVVGIMPNDPASFDLVTPEYSEADNVHTPVSLLTASKCTASLFETISDISMDDNGVVNGVVRSQFNPRPEGNQTRGIGLVKAGSLIKAYDGKYIHLALVKVDDASKKAWITGNSKTNGEELLGYYNSLKEATDVINARKDSTAQYAIVLIDDLTDTDKNGKYTGTISIPTVAAAVGIQGDNGEKTVGLKSLSITNNVCLSQVKICVDTTVTATKGKTLSFRAGSTLSAKGMITLENIVNVSGSNVIEFSRTANAANTSQLKINGTVTNLSDSQLILKMKNLAGDDNYTVGGYTVTYTAEITKNNSKQLVVAPKVTPEDVDIKVESSNLNETPSSTAPTLVKAKDAFYYVSSVFAKGFAGVAVDDGSPVVYCLDLNQAFVQIKGFGDSTKKDYTVFIGCLFGHETDDCDIKDVNILDNVAHSKMELPANNVVASLKIAPFPTDDYNPYKTNIYYSGDITGYVAGGCCLTFSCVTLKNVAANNDKNGNIQNVDTGRITLGRNSSDKSGEVTLYFDRSENSTFNQITGTKGVTNLSVENNDIKKGITLKTGLSNINRLTIKSANVTTFGTNTIGEIYFSDYASEFVSAGTTTVDYLKTTGNIMRNGNGPKISTVGGDKFKVNKTVTTNRSVILIELIKPTSKYSTIEKYDDITGAKEMELYLGTNLIYAPMADASAFMAYPYGLNSSVNGKALVSCKSGKYVSVVKKADMKIQVYSTGSVPLTAYAASYKEAIDSINTWNIKQDYVISFLSTETYTTTVTGVTTGKESVTWGAMTFPNASAASSLVIKGVYNNNNTVDDKSDDKYTIVQFTGAIKPSVDVRFEDVALSSGSLNKKEWTSNGIMALDLSNASIDLGTGVTAAYENAKNVISDELNISTIKGTKGELTVSDRYINIYDAVTVGTLNVSGNVEVNLTMSTFKSINIGMINGSKGKDCLSLPAPINTSPMLKISGEINSNLEKLELYPYVKDKDGHPRMAYISDVEKLYVKGNEKTADLNKKRIADIVKVPTNIINICFLENTKENDEDVTVISRINEDHVTKIGGFAYITYQKLSVLLSEKCGYISQFMSIYDAFADIEKLGNKSGGYDITLYSDQGCVNKWTNQIGAFNMPKNASYVNITGTENTIYTTSTSITFNVNSILNNVSIVPVKQKYSDANYGYLYEPGTTQISYNIASAVSVQMIGVDMKLAKISGGELSLSGDTFINTTGGISVKSLWMMSNSEISSDSKVSITAQTEAYLNDQSVISVPYGTVSLKDAYFGQCDIYAANVTMTGITEIYNECNINACGDNVAGQGKVSIQNIDLNSEDGLTIYAKPDASGKSQISITGMINTYAGNSHIKIGFINPVSTGLEYMYTNPRPGVKLVNASKITPDEYEEIF